MKISRSACAVALGALLLLGTNLRAGEPETPPAKTVPTSSVEAYAPHLEISSETAYLLSIAGNPNSYEIGAQFLTARLRWGINDNDNSFFRGYT